MKFIHPIAGLFLAALLATSSTSFSAPLEVGDAASNVLEMHLDGATPFASVPLTEGQGWTIEFTNLRTSTNTQSRFRSTNLVQSQNDKVVASIEVNEKVDGTTIKLTDEPCKVDNVYLKNDYGTRLWKQKCLVIRPVTWLQGTNKYTTDLLASLAKRGIKNDFNAIKLSYTRYGDINKFLSYSMFLFPSTFGLDNSMAPSMNASPWSMNNFTSDPEKVKFIEEVKSYGEYMVTELDKAYETGQAAGPLKPFTFSK